MMIQVEHEALPGGYWWACQFPERPNDGKAFWSNDCRACMVALAALAHREPEHRLFDATMWSESGEPSLVIYNRHCEAVGLPRLEPA